MRRVLLSALTLAVVALVVWRTALAFVSDETRIRWRLQDMSEAFDEARLRPIASGLAPDFHDRTTGYERALVLDLLRAFYLEHARGPLPYAVDLPEDRIAVELGADGRSATATFVADFTALADDSAQLAWSVEIQAELEHTDSGWRILSSRHDTLTGDARRLR
jgi:hypothetical protein